MEHEPQPVAAQRQRRNAEQRHGEAAREVEAEALAPLQLRVHVTLGGHLVPHGRRRRLDRLQGVILLRQLRSELGKAAEQTRARRLIGGGARRRRARFDRRAARLDVAAAAITRFRAARQRFSLISTPSASRPAAFAAASTVPWPQNGSTIVVAPKSRQNSTA